MSAPRDWGTWFAAHEVMEDAPAAFEEHRKSLGLSYRAVSEQVDITPSMLSKFGRGHDLSSSDLRRILLWMAWSGKTAAAHADGGAK